MNFDKGEPSARLDKLNTPQSGKRVLIAVDNECVDKDIVHDSSGNHIIYYFLANEDTGDIDTMC